MSSYYLGRERIVGRTILSAIPLYDHDTEPMLDSLPIACPKHGVARHLLDVDNAGNATCAECGLILADAAPPIIRKAAF